MADVIRHKRDGGTLEPEAIRKVIAGVTDGSIPDYQASALLMAVFFRGLDDNELVVWTDAMLHSGDVFDMSHLSGAKVDKHSTGGVGDKISIPLAPLVSSCGVRVPMISGRGLGHTGGTLDKLESIPGFRTDMSPARFLEGVRTIGACMVGQTESIVPADKRLYALRDVTGTVESIPLISASILSKKLAEGISGLVLDVKVGSGAFMKTREQATLLARTMVGLGTRSGVRTVAYLTDMNQPIGWAVGNALEIEESIEVLRGAGPADTVELVVTLGGRMLVLGGVSSVQTEGEALIRAAIADGRGLETFRRMVEFQGGDPAVVDNTDLLPRARNQVDVRAGRGGVVQAINCELLGLAAVAMGGGRRRKEDGIDPAVGLRVLVRLGDPVVCGQPLVTLMFNDSRGLSEAEYMVHSAYSIGDQVIEVGQTFIDVIE